jgi:hypothetical protein
VWVFFMFVNSPISNLYLVLERQGLHLFLMVLTLVGRIGALVFGWLVARDVAVAVLLFSLVSALVSLLRVSLLVWLTRARPWFILKHFALHLAYAAPTVAVLAYLKWSLGMRPIVLVSAAFVLAVPYVILAMRRDEELRGAFGKIVRKFRR